MGYLHTSAQIWGRYIAIRLAESKKVSCRLYRSWSRALGSPHHSVLFYSSQTLCMPGQVIDLSGVHCSQLVSKSFTTNREHFVRPSLKPLDHRPGVGNNRQHPVSVSRGGVRARGHDESSQSSVKRPITF